MKNKLITGNGHIIAAKNIRTELKDAFPTVKFSVRSESFSGGDAVRISWTDGPTSNQVSDISGKYKAGRFGTDEHGNQDIYTYSKDSSNHGSTKYITTCRELSDEFRAELIECVAGHYGSKDKPTAEQWRGGQAFSITPFNDWSGHWSWQDILYRASVNSSPGHAVASEY